MSDGARFISQGDLAQADPISLKVALMAITKAAGLIVAPAGYALHFNLIGEGAAASSLVTETDPSDEGKT